MALGKTVRQMLHDMDASEFAEWQAYYRLEPWGELRADSRALYQGHASIAPYQKKGASPLRAKDYFDHLFRERHRRQRRQTAEEMKDLLRGFTLACGGEVK